MIPKSEHYYCKHGVYELTHVHGKLRQDILKTISSDCNMAKKLSNAVNDERAIYRSGFKVHKNLRGQGHGYKMHIASLDATNLPPNVEYVFLFVNRENIRALNMHMKAGGRICGIGNGKHNPYLIWYRV